MYPVLDSLPPFIEGGASNGRMCFLTEKKGARLSAIRCVLSRRILNSQRTEWKKLFLKTPFSEGHILFFIEKIYMYTARGIGCRETFLLL